MLTANQLEVRRNRIGASELFGIIEDPYRTWYYKVTGKARFTGKEEFLRVGNLFERPTAEDYAWRRAQSGSPVRLVQTATETGDAVTLLDPVRPWFCGTPDFLPVYERRQGTIIIPDLATIQRLMDSGELDRGLEIKTNSAIAERLLEADDQWGEGYKVAQTELESLLDGHPDAARVAQELMRRYTLQRHIGGASAETEEDQWGDPGTSQMPRRYLAQCAGYMALTGLPRWDLHRMRAGWGRFEMITYTVHRDPELEGLLFDAAEKFVVDHLLPQKPPPQLDIESRSMELERVFPRENGAMRPADSADILILEAFREATIEAKKAEVRKDLIELEVQKRIGNDKGLDARGAGIGNVSWGNRSGRVSVNAIDAVNALVESLRGKVPDNELATAAKMALESATKIGDPYRKMSRPQAWTKGLEEIVRMELAEK